MEISQELDFTAILLPLTGIIFVIALGVVFLNQQFRKNLYKQSLQQEALKSEHQQNLLQVSMQVQEDERKRIAQDLHDELGAALSIGRMQLVQLEQHATSEKQKLTEVRKLIEDTLATTRRISHKLMPLQLSTLGLEKTLRSLISKAAIAGDLKVDLEFSDDCHHLPSLMQLGLYRIYSELINNTLKHSAASSLCISITKESGQLLCKYADNGKGLDQNKKTGLGLRSIENRIHTLGGSVKLGTAEKGGFFARILFPSTKSDNT